MSSGQIDTPDNQLGVVNAQVLLARVPGGTTSVTVNVPPNAETLIVTGFQIGATTRPQVQGVTTGDDYPGVLTSNSSLGPGGTAFFDVAQSLDTQVLVTAPNAVGAWYVYADGGVHLVGDVSNYRSLRGNQYVITTAPSELQSDRPLPEIQSVAFFNVTTTQNLLNAPGAGQRYRIYGAWAVNVGSGDTCLISGVQAGHAVYFAAAGNGFPSIPLTGIALDTNTAVQLQALFGSSGNYLGCLLYTQETA